MNSGIRILFLTILGSLLVSLYAQGLPEGIALYRQGRTGEAKKIFDGLIQQNKNYADAHYWLGRIYLVPAFKDYDRAVDEMEEAVDLNANSAEFHFGLGEALGLKTRDAGVFKQAMLAPKVRKAFERAAQLDPGHLGAHRGLAEFYWQAPGIMGGDTEKAWKEADMILRIDETQGRLMRATFFERQKNLAEAENEVRQLLAHRPRDWRAQRAAGLWYLRNQKTDDAIAALKQYTALRPDTADSYARLAQAYLQKKDADRALQLTTKALTIDKDSFNAISFQAYALELKGQKKEALERYQKLLALDLSEEQRKNLEKKIKELQ
ncbi:MAG: tetratricopeptide repeat protein [bacterium]